MKSTNISFSNYLSSYSISKLKDKSVPITNTRIGDKDSNVYGGSYSIQDEKYQEFLNKYYDFVFDKKGKEYLTEKQLDENCPILVDIDFRYSYEVGERQHTTEHIIDLLQLYLEDLKKLVIFDDNITFPIYILEKKI